MIGINEEKAVIVIIEKDEKYFVFHRSPTKKSMPNKWQFVAGHIEKNETPFETAERETMEETQCKIKILEIGNPYTAYEKEIDTLWTITPVFCKFVSGTIKLNEEHTEWKLATLEEMKKLDFVPSSLEKLEEFIHK